MSVQSITSPDGRIVGDVSTDGSLRGRVSVDGISTAHDAPLRLRRHNEAPGDDATLG